MSEQAQRNAAALRVCGKKHANKTVTTAPCASIATEDASPELRAEPSRRLQGESHSAEEEKCGQADNVWGHTHIHR